MILGDRKHFVRNLQDAYLFREALGARTRPRVAFAAASQISNQTGERDVFDQRVRRSR